MLGKPLATMGPRVAHEVPAMSPLVVHTYWLYICIVGQKVRARVFWSGGSQAVRLPKALRVEGSEVLVQRRGHSIVIEPAPDDGWGDFWDRLLVLREPVRRHSTRPAERRRPL